MTRIAALAARILRARPASVSVAALAALTLLITSTAGGALAAGTPHGTVAVKKPLRWRFPPVGGPSGDSADFKLTVKLPEKGSKLYAPDVRTGTRSAAVLTIRLTWKGSNPDDSLCLSANNRKGNSVGDDTFATSNDGGNVNVFMIETPRHETYTVQAFNGAQLTFRINSLTVDYHSAAVDGVLAEGTAVAVQGLNGAGEGTFIASRVEALPAVNAASTAFCLLVAAS